MRSPVVIVFSIAVSLLVLKLASFRRQALARGRLAAAGDRDRRSLERDLHDGAQQRLLSVSLVLAYAHHRLDPGTEEATLLARRATSWQDRSRSCGTLLKVSTPRC